MLNLHVFLDLRNWKIRFLYLHQICQMGKNELSCRTRFPEWKKNELSFRTRFAEWKKNEKKTKKKRKNMNFFIFFSFFFRSESSFRFRSDLKVHFFFIPRLFGIFSQTSSLIVFVLKLQVYDFVKHELVFFQFWFLHLFPPSQP